MLTANIEDPVRMYLVVRESLGMSPGKIAAQVGHAVQLIMYDAMFYLLKADLKITVEQLDRRDLTLEWLDAEYGKIVVKASDKEFEQVKLDHAHIVVVDNGHTEVAPKSETVLGLWPMHKSQRSKTLKRLQLL